MGKQDVDPKAVEVRKDGATDGTGIRLLERAYVVVTQVFCPNGHNLVGAGPTAFEGFPGIALWVGDGRTEGLVELSPIHGDGTKRGPDFQAGAKLHLECPVCRAELPRLAHCSCHEDGELRKLFLTDKLDDAYVVGLCDVWGCTRSRVIDGNEILSEWFAGNIRP
jgi:hypothetical protein